MELKHQHSEHDAVVAKVLAKTLEYVQAEGINLAKVTISAQDHKGHTHIYTKNVDGLVTEVVVCAKLGDGRQFVDCSIYEIGKSDYQAWSVSTPGEFFSALNQEIAARSSNRTDEETLERVPGL